MSFDVELKPQSLFNVNFGEVAGPKRLGYLKVGDDWKLLRDTFICIDEQWKQVTAKFVLVDGVWKEVLVEAPIIPEATWEILMRVDGSKTVSRNETPLGNPGSATFMTMTETSTGANAKSDFTDSEGLFTAFFNKTDITKIAFVDGTGSLDPATHDNYLIYDLVESTGAESINDILKRLDIYQRDAPAFHNNDTVWGDPSVLNHTAGTNGYSGLLVESGGTAFRAFSRAGANLGLPDKFAVMGINRDSDNDIQALCAFFGNLQTGKGDAWRGNNPEQTFWSYWGHDFHSSSSTQRIGSSRQTNPGIATQVTTYSGPVYMMALSG